MIKKNNMFLESAASTQLNSDLDKHASDVVVVKSRVGPFSTTALKTILHANGVTRFAIAGISTSGVVLHTVTEGVDSDFKITVLSDGCLDTNAEVHNALINHVFVRRADVITIEQYVAAQQ